MDKRYDDIRKLLDMSYNCKLIMVCNSKSIVPRFYLRENEFDPAIEYLSDNELEEILEMLYDCKISYDIYYDETDFMKSIINNQNIPNDLVVYNSAQSGYGAGRKSLIPAFCQLYRIRITGSNPYVVALCRNKFHVNRILSSLGVPVPNTYYFDNGWLMKRRPPNGMQLIIKPNYESSSIGIDDNSLVTPIYSSKFDKMIQARQQLLKQPLVVQEFIPGYEVEVPCVIHGKNCTTLHPVGLKMKDANYQMDNHILDYNHIYNNDYEFYDYGQIRPIKHLQQFSQIIASILGMTGLCRVDYRIKENGNFFITDVSTNPHFISHSSVNYAFHLAGFTSSDIMRTIITCCIFDN